MSLSLFCFFLELGWKHIIQIDALDHILFLLTISGMAFGKKITHWLIVTLSFTIGHSLSMWLGSYFSYSPSIIEFLIPVTIIGSGLWIWIKQAVNQIDYFYLILIMIFGCIHGLGFASAYEMMLPSSSKSIDSLIGFTLGLEAGQILILFLFVFSGHWLTKSGLVSHFYFSRATSLFAILGGVYLAICRWPF